MVRPVRVQGEELQCNHRWQQRNCDPSRHPADRLQNDLKTRASKLENAQETYESDSFLEQLGLYQQSNAQARFLLTAEKSSISHEISSRTSHHPKPKLAGAHVKFHLKWSFLTLSTMWTQISQRACGQATGSSREKRSSNSTAAGWATRAQYLHPDISTPSKGVIVTFDI